MTVLDWLTLPSCKPQQYESENASTWDFPCGLQVLGWSAEKKSVAGPSMREAHEYHHEEGYQKRDWLLLETVELGLQTVKKIYSCDCENRKEWQRL